MDTQPSGMLAQERAFTRPPDAAPLPLEKTPPAADLESTKGDWLLKSGTDFELEGHVYTVLLFKVLDDPHDPLVVTLRRFADLPTSLRLSELLKRGAKRYSPLREIPEELQ